MPMNKQRVRDHLNEEKFEALSEIIADVARNHPSMEMKAFLWARARTLLIESGEDIEDVARAILARLWD